MVVPLIVLICQQRSNILFNTKTEHLKLLGRLYDTCQMTLVQFCEFIFTAVQPVSDYAKLIPSLPELLDKYHLQPSMAFHLIRPTLRDASGDSKTVDLFPKQLLSSSLLPASTLESISPELYLAFWCCSLYDIYTPTARYEEEINRLRKECNRLRNSAEDEADKRKKKKEADKHMMTISSLQEEQLKQSSHRSRVLAAIERQKGLWLLNIENRNKTVETILQTCVFPRAVISPEDALYTAKFFALLHSRELAFFSSIQYYDKVSRELTPTIYCSTEREASNLGIFFRETLRVLVGWYRDKRLYAKECDKPGFCVNFSDPSSKRASYEEYRRVFTRWHDKISKLFLTRLQSTEYMDLRNTLVVLTKIVDVFPATIRVWTILQKRVATIKEEDRDDLKTFAAGYHSKLMKMKASLPNDPEAAAAKPAAPKGGGGGRAAKPAAKADADAGGTGRAKDSKVGVKGKDDKPDTKSVDAKAAVKGKDDKSEDAGRKRDSKDRDRQQSNSGDTKRSEKFDSKDRDRQRDGSADTKKSQRDGSADTKKSQRDGGADTKKSQRDGSAADTKKSQRDGSADTKKSQRDGGADKDGGRKRERDRHDDGQPSKRHHSDSQSGSASTTSKSTSAGKPHALVKFELKLTPCMMMCRG
jgi:THO complex subunit 2